MADPAIGMSVDQQLSPENWITQFSSAETLRKMPAIVDLIQRMPPNPPAHIQEQFVGHSYEVAYSEAFSFAHVVGQWSLNNGRGSLASLDRVLDFGSGWGRVTRVLLACQVNSRNIIAAAVDQEMSALISVALPGVTALTVDPMPPTFLGDATLDLVTAYSVFSHLSPEAHEGWAHEFGRLVADGGLVVITVLDRSFFEQIQWSVDAAKTGDANAVSNSLAGAFPDLVGATATFDQGGFVYSGTGGAGVRTGDFYGWAVAPKPYIEDIWGAAGFDVIQWVPSGVLFEQAVLALRRRARVGPPTGWRYKIRGWLEVRDRRIRH